MKCRGNRIFLEKINCKYYLYYVILLHCKDSNKPQFMENVNVASKSYIMEGVFSYPILVNVSDGPQTLHVLHINLQCIIFTELHDWNVIMSNNQDLLDCRFLLYPIPVRYTATCLFEVSRRRGNTSQQFPHQWSQG